jgi:hypothetical protein
MSSAADRPAQGDGHCAAGRTVFVSLELSRTKWLVMSLSPGSAKMAKHVVTGGDGDALRALLAQLRGRAKERCGAPAAVVAIHEAGLDGFWVHRLLEANGVESHVVEAASIAMPRRHRRAKADVIDGEALLRVLMAFRRDEPRVCSTVVPPTPEEEDRRRVSRGCRTLQNAGPGAHGACEPYQRAPPPRVSPATSRCAEMPVPASTICGRATCRSGGCRTLRQRPIHHGNCTTTRRRNSSLPSGSPSKANLCSGQSLPNAA